jgi:hypothetical protein
MTRRIAWLIVAVTGSKALKRDLLEEEIRDGDPLSWPSQRGDGSLGPEHGDRPVAPAERGRGVGLGIAVGLEDPLREIHDPVVGEPGPGVEAALVLAVQREAGLAHLDHEHGTRGVAGLIVAKAPRHDRQVRLRLGVLIEGERASWIPSRVERDRRASSAARTAAKWPLPPLGDDEMTASS